MHVHVYCTSDLAANLIMFLNVSVSVLAGLRWNTSGSRTLSFRVALNRTDDLTKLAARSAYQLRVGRGGGGG